MPRELDQLLKVGFIVLTAVVIVVPSYQVFYHPRMGGGPPKPPTSGPQAAELYYISGLDALEKKRDKTEAEKYFRQSLQADPENPEALAVLGMVLFNEHRDEEAHADLQAAIEPHPDWKSPLVSGRKLVIGNSIFLNDYAMLCARLGDEAKSQEVTQMVIDNFDPFPHVLEIDRKQIKEGLHADAIIYLEQGIYASRAKRDEEALRDFREANRLEPNQPLVQCYLGIGLLNSGMASDGQVVLEQAKSTGNSTIKNVVPQIQERWNRSHDLRPIWP